MSRRDDELERWLGETANSPEFKALRDKSEAAGPLPEDLIARYYAGLLSPEEEALVARQIALDGRNLRVLAELQEDIAGAAGQVEPSRIRRYVARVASWFEPFEPAKSLRYAGAAAAIVLAAYLGVQVTDRPPEVGPAFHSALLERPRGGEPTPELYRLPWGEPLARVDPEWPLHQPLGVSSRARWFAWRPLEGAESYGLALYGPGGALLHRSERLITAYTKLPRAVRRRLARGTEYVWVVEARFRAPTEPIRAVGTFRLE